MFDAFGAGALIEIFKQLFHRPRPPASLQVGDIVTGYGFPSAHALTIVAIGAACWYLMAVRGRGWGSSYRAKARAAAVTVALVIVVGAGRVYTGAHYPSDVLGGWALGGLWASICITAAELYRRTRR